MSARRAEAFSLASSNAEVLGELDEIGDQRCTALALAMLADMVHQQGDDAAAIEHLRRAVSFFCQVNDQASLLECVELAARIRPLCPDPRQRARLLGAAAALRDRIGVPRELPNEAAYDRCLAGGPGDDSR